MLQTERQWDLFSMWVLDFFHLPYSSSYIMALGLAQPLTEASSSNFPGGKLCSPPSVSRLCRKYSSLEPHDPINFHGLL
jgi:hypothetical protein